MKNTRIISIPLFALLTATLAQAHAFLEESEPRVGSTVQASPTQVKIWFTEKLAHGDTKIEIFNTGGTEVDKKDSAIDPANPLLMTVSVTSLPPGFYKVKWIAIAIDTHHTTGTFSFEIRP